LRLTGLTFFLLRPSLDLQARTDQAKAALQSKGGGRPPAVDAILRAARPGGELANVGVLGRLGDLATIPEKYDVAVSTACTMLNYIVVHTTAGTQKCLAYLRKHNLGRANFIPLDKMKKGAHDRIVETPENAPRLFNLINVVNFAVAPAIFLAVKNTVVAPDLQTASRWAYDFGKRWRVVTIDGNLIEASGAMSGGGKSVRRGGMKLSVRFLLHCNSASYVFGYETNHYPFLRRTAALQLRLLHLLSQTMLPRSANDLNKSLRGLSSCYMPVVSAARRLPKRSVGRRRQSRHSNSNFLS